MGRRIGVSVISMVPYASGNFGLDWAVMLAHDAGFDGLQILPMRGWDHKTFMGVSREEIISYENAWNCGSLQSAILRHLHLAGEDHPTLYDLVLFGNCKVAKYRMELIIRYFGKSSFFVSHDLQGAIDQGSLLEMNPEIRAEIQDYRTFPHGLVWDTEHVIRSGRHGEPPVSNNWRELLEEVENNIKMIHVKNSTDPEMLKALAKRTYCPVIFEGKPSFGYLFNPPFITAEKRLIECLKERREFLSSFF